MLTKENILSFSSRSTGKKTIEVPEWGGSVCIRVMSARERDSFEADLCGEGKGKMNYDNFRAKLVAKCLCDEEGKRIFADNEAEKLGDLEANVIMNLFAECQKLNGLAGAEIEEMKKN